MCARDAKPEEGSVLAGLCKIIGETDEQEEIDCWPENWDAINLFALLQTRFNVSVEWAMETRGIDKARHAETFEALRIMEEAALESMR